MNPRQLAFFEASRTSDTTPPSPRESAPVVRAIESPDFPFEHFSEVAELESWRKEVNRPIYHIHKWWAQRLGSVFRAIILGSLAAESADLLDMFYKPVRFPDAIIFDPFMGSGTTIGEAAKLGARAIGRDINPVAHFQVKTVLTLPHTENLHETFRGIDRDVSPRIRAFYTAKGPDGRQVTVLYYFWVKQVKCPLCVGTVDLFPSYVFSHHAYPSRDPSVRATCPNCGGIVLAQHDTRTTTCSFCHWRFDPYLGPAHGQKATCPQCGGTFQIAAAVRLGNKPPGHRMYAKMVLMPDGSKEYLPADEHDRSLFEAASEALRLRPDSFPKVAIRPGFNTKQILNYCYTQWHQLFNGRQLLCLGILADSIAAIQDENLREAFCCLFSGALEFNNMFASFKGEGTGAVRHMFSHHILKPERTPLEANPWGTPRSSGAFSTLFQSRILRAAEYSRDPFEIRPARISDGLTTKKVFGLSEPLFQKVQSSYGEFAQQGGIYLSCGDSSSTDLPSSSVDAVVTDPPFFDNVHYSELADFFYVWQRKVLGATGMRLSETTRSDREVQQSDALAFTDRLGMVWRECHRVLKDDGILVFTYHHSRSEGWWCVLQSLRFGGFTLVRAHPIKSEMSVAAPKHQAQEPIDLDMILVCRKTDTVTQSAPGADTRIAEASREASDQISRFGRTGRKVSRNDVRVILMAQILVRLSGARLDDANLEQELEHLGPLVERTIDALYKAALEHPTPTPHPTGPLPGWPTPACSSA